MGTFIVFLMKSTCCLAVFYLFYRLLLSRDTFHRFNRLALLGVIAFSAAIPFVRLITEAPVAIQQPVQNLEYLLRMAEMQVQAEADPTSLSVWLTAALAAYLAGCLFFAGRFLYSIFHILRLIRSGEKVALEGDISLVVTEQTVSPFSWMRYIVISRIDMEESGEEILTHELAHIRAGHSADMLLAGACVILHWFNPAARLLKQELQNVHEFEADESVITHGVDAKKYQLLLINKAVGTQRFTSMANSFNHSKLKKRIAMMLKQKSNPWARLKYLYVLPLAAVAVVAFARPEISSRLEKISNVDVPEVVQPHAPKAALQENMLPQEQKVTDTKPQVRKKKQIVLMAVAPTPIDTVVVVGYRPQNKQAASVWDLGKADTMFPKRTLEFKSDMKKVGGIGYIKSEPLFFIDGAEVSASEMKNLDAEMIESISIMKDRSAEDLYGSRAANGVVLITTKGASKKQDN